MKGEIDAVGGSQSGTGGAARDRTGPRRRPRQPAQAVDRPARQAGGVFRRQVPHRRLRAVELPQLGHPPHRRLDPVQGAQPVAASADGLVVSAPGDERVSRPVASAAADRRGDLVPRHRRRRVTRTSTSSRPRARNTSSSWRATTSTRWTIPTCSPTTSTRGAECTVGCVEVPIEEATRLRRDGGRRVRCGSSIFSKSRPPRRRCRASPTSARQHGHLRVLGRLPLRRIGARPPRSDIEPRFRQGRDPAGSSAAASRSRIHFEDSCVKTTPDAEAYWRDVGTIDAYWAANLDLVMPVPSLDIYDPNWPIWTYQQQLPPAKFVFNDDDRRGMAVDSMVSGGCIISGAYGLAARCCFRAAASIRMPRPR